MARLVPSILIPYFFLLAVPAAFSQEAKEELALFSLSHYEFQVPGGALSLVDESIAEVFASYGLYAVAPHAYRIDTDGVEQLAETIRSLEEKAEGPPETIRLGPELVEDFPALYEASLAVVPVMVGYRNERVDDRYTANLELTFSFIDIQMGGVSQVVSVAVSGSADTAQGAVQGAADTIADALVSALKNLPEFQIKSGIIDVRGRRVFLSFGKVLGVRPGDEYAIVERDTGDPVETGLIIIDEVKDKISIATLLYSEQELRPDDLVMEIPRSGFDTGAKMRTIILRDEIVSSIGVRQSISRGLFSYRPFIGLDIPFAIDLTPGTPKRTDLPGLIFHLYAGGEMNWYLWKFQFVPSVALGIGPSIPVGDGDALRFSHAGGFAEMVTHYMINRNVKLSFALGYSSWFALSPEAGDSYFGPALGFGATYKY